MHEFEDYTNGYFAVDLMSFSSGNSLIFNAAMVDNITGGTYWEKPDHKLGEADVTWVDDTKDDLKGTSQNQYYIANYEDGTIYEMKFGFMHLKDFKYKVIEFNGTSNTDTNVRYFDIDLIKQRPLISQYEIGQGYNHLQITNQYYKDNKELIDMSLQFEYVCDNGVFISPWFARLNDLITNFYKQTKPSYIYNTQISSLNNIMVALAYEESINKEFAASNYLNNEAIQYLDGFGHNYAGASIPNQNGRYYITRGTYYDISGENVGATNDTYQFSNPILIFGIDQNVYNNASANEEFYIEYASGSFSISNDLWDKYPTNPGGNPYYRGHLGDYKSEFVKFLNIDIKSIHIKKVQTSPTYIKEDITTETITYEGYQANFKYCYAKTAPSGSNVMTSLQVYNLLEQIVSQGFGRRVTNMNMVYDIGSTFYDNLFENLLADYQVNFINSGDPTKFYPGGSVYSSDNYKEVNNQSITIGNIADYLEYCKMYTEDISGWDDPDIDAYYQKQFVFFYEVKVEHLNAQDNWVTDKTLYFVSLERYYDLTNSEYNGYGPIRYEDLSDDLKSYILNEYSGDLPSGYEYRVTFEYRNDNMMYYLSGSGYSKADSLEIISQDTYVTNTHNYSFDDNFDSYMIVECVYETNKTDPTTNQPRRKTVLKKLPLTLETSAGTSNPHIVDGNYIFTTSLRFLDNFNPLQLDLVDASQSCVITSDYTLSRYFDVENPDSWENTTTIVSGNTTDIYNGYPTTMLNAMKAGVTYNFKNGINTFTGNVNYLKDTLSDYVITEISHNLLQQSSYIEYKLYQNLYYTISQDEISETYKYKKHYLFEDGEHTLDIIDITNTVNMTQDITENNDYRLIISTTTNLNNFKSFSVFYESNERLGNWNGQNNTTPDGYHNNTDLNFVFGVNLDETSIKENNGIYSFSITLSLLQSRDRRVYSNSNQKIGNLDDED